MLLFKRFASVSLSVLAMFLMLSSSGCGKAPSTTTTTGTTTSTAATISLTSTGTKVNSDGTNSVTLTATVLDSSNSILSGQALTVAATTGQISASSLTTDTSGKATLTFSAGPSGVNRTATITFAATGSAATASIPIQITGSTLNLTSTSTSAPTGTPVTVSIVAKDAGSNTVSGQSLRYSVASSSTGSGTLSTATGTTSSTGTASVSLTGTAAGTVDVLVEWLDSTGTVTASATKSFTITAAGSSFSVVTPASTPFAVSIGTNQPVVLNIPATGVASIRYATTLGSWLQDAAQANCNTLGQKVCTVSYTGTTDTRTFVPGNNAGNASIQIDALNTAGAVVYTASLTLSISSPATNASKITLQSNVSVLPASAGTTLSTATLTATVLDSSNNPVGGAPVLFELVNSTGTGESISPVIATTNTTTPLGQAKATFTAGTSTTLNSAVRASIVGLSAASAVQSIVVGGTVGSISIGTSNKLAVINSDTAYQLPVTIMVSDSNGNAVSGAVVTLSLWPSYYYKGYRSATCAPVTGGVFFVNEDINANLINDAGEDTDGPGGLTFDTATSTYTYGRGNPDGALWPSQASAGSIPATVTTDTSGIATFNYIYLKQYANWLTVRMTASTQVLGSQSNAATYIYLKALDADNSAPTCLFNSPFN